MWQRDWLSLQEAADDAGQADLHLITLSHLIALFTSDRVDHVTAVGTAMADRVVVMDPSNRLHSHWMPTPGGPVAQLLTSYRNAQDTKGMNMM